jgi:hypothetical protein
VNHCLSRRPYLVFGAGYLLEEIAVIMPVRAHTKRSYKSMRKDVSSPLDVRERYYEENI